MTKKLVFILVSLFLGITMTLAQMGPDVPKDPAVRVGKLDNGLTYYIRHNAKPEKQANFYIFHNVGAIQEDDSQVGLAHFLEHMAFNGTKNFPDNGLREYLQTIGVKFGENLNAGTGQEMTMYMITNVPLKRDAIIDSALLVLHDWSYFISLEEDAINEERGVIIEELRTGNNANRRTQEAMFPIMFNNSKYAQRNIIGNEEQLKSFPRQAIVDFYHKWYRTDLQAVIVVGDFDVDQMEAKVKSVMADIPAVENPTPKEMIPIPDNTTPLVGIVTDPELQMSRVTFMIKREPIPQQFRSSQGVYAMNIMLDYITTMMNYRLQDIVLKPGAPFTQTHFAYGSLTQTSDVLQGIAIAKDGETAQAFKALYTEIEKARRFGFTQSEFERAKEDMLRSAQQAYDNREDIRHDQRAWEYIANFQSNDPMPDAETKWNMDKMIIEALDLNSINAVVQQLITPTNQVVMIVSPQKEGVAVPTEQDILDIITAVGAEEMQAPVDDTVKEPLISAELKGSKVKKTAENKIFGATEWTLANGVKVVFKQTDFKADEIIMDADTRGGTSVLSDADFVTGEQLQLFFQFAGVGKFTAADLQKQLSGKVVSVSPYINSYDNGISGNASVKDFETMLQLTYLYFAEPRFAQEEFDNAIDKYKSILSNITSNPDYIFQDSVENASYNHNFRRQIISIDRLGEVKFDRMAPVYKQLFGNAANFTFTFVGNVAPETAKPLIEKYLGSLPVSKSKLNSVDDKVRTVTGKATTRFSLPMQTPKTSVAMILRGETPYNLESKFYFDVLHQILDLRYTASIREEMGGTYGVGTASSVSSMPVNAYRIYIKCDTKPELTDAVAAKMIEEIEKIATEGPLAEDVAKVKEFLIKQRPDDLKKNSVWRTDIDLYYLNGVDMFSDYDKLMNGLSADKVKEYAAKMLKDGNILTVIMEPAKE
jgi:zinc protease